MSSTDPSSSYIQNFIQFQCCPPEKMVIYVDILLRF